MGTYSSQRIGTCQCSAQSRTKRKVASTSLPVLAKQTTVSAGRPPLVCSTRQSMYALVRPPLKLMQVGWVILNGSCMRRLQWHAGGLAGEAGLGGRRRARTRGHSRCAEERKPPGNRRSEEHTSELQSLMRIPYGVYCMNKK